MQLSRTRLWPDRTLMCLRELKGIGLNFASDGNEDNYGAFALRV
jgi:hypothetical protein